MIKYKKHTIEVTQEHIDEGVPTSCTDCALSLAFKDSLVKVNVNNCLVQTNMSDGEVQLQYTHDGIIFGANLNPFFDDFTPNLQDKINAFVKEYDNSFISCLWSNTMPLADFTPRYCVPFTFDVGLPV